MKSSRRLRPLLSFTLCCSLIPSSLIPTSSARKIPALGQGKAQAGRGKKVRPEPAQPGAPAASLPDLDEVRHLPQLTPQVPPPIPSTARSRRKPLVSRGGRRVGDPLPIPTATPLPTATPPIPVPSPTAPAPTPVMRGASSGDGGASPADFSPSNAVAGTRAYASYFPRFLVSPSDDQLQSLSSSLSFSGPAAYDLDPSFDFFTLSMLQAGGAKIAFASNRDGHVQIYLMNADGSGQFRLTNSSGNDDAPRFSPSGAKILFQSDRDDPVNGYYDIYVMNADGGAQTRLTTDANDDCAPSWSPDGTKVVFQSLRNGQFYQVYSMNADGSGQLNLSNSTGSDRQPSWSPNGSKIAFVSTRDGNKEIYVMNADGTNQTRLTADPGNDDSPYWSPDGAKLIFRSDRERDYCDPTAQVWVMNADGASPVNLSGNGFGDYSSSWIAGGSGNQPPVANAGGSYSGMTGQNTVFSGAGSFDSDGQLASYSWSFGDGGTGVGVSPTHAYSSPGSYAITLTVTDNLGAQASAGTTATVSSSSSDGFVQNFLQWGLARQPHGDEGSYWTDIMRAAYPRGQGSMLLSMREFGMTVFESSEYAARNRSDHGYVYDLYKSYLMRDPDPQGWVWWESQLPSMGREQLRHAFDESIEFGNIVATLSASGQPSAAVSSLATARIDPFNETGDQLRSRDCEWGVTLLSLPGRSGLDLGLGLSYSSLVWTRSGPYAYFDEDRGSPSLGFRLGFATIQGPFFDAQVGRNAYVLVTSSGSRTELRQVGTTSTYEAGDSSYLQLIAGSSSLLVRSTDGTQMSYAPLGDGWRATAIEDRNGNLINVSYDWRGDITNVTDTLGRVITFNYDTNANLSTIMQSWQGNSAAQPHKWARFDWNNVTLQPSFALSAVGTYGGETIPVLEQVWLDDDTHYSFEYTGAGQVNVIRRYSSDNLERSRTTYDYATLADDCPRVIDTRVWADNWTGINGVPSEVITQFNDPGDGSHEMIAPDGTVYKESYGTGWQKGLVTGSEVRSGGTLQKQTTRQWTQDDTSAGYQTNPRVIETNIYDFPVNTPSNRRRTTIDYGQYAQYGLPHLVTEYASDGTTPLRQSYTDYNLAQGYLDRRIIGLVSSSQVYDSTAAKWLSKTTYAFDEPGSVQQQAVAAAGHDQSYDSTFLTRGNVSSASRWDVTDITNTAKTLTSRVSYDAAGSALTATDPAGHQSSISYADSYSDSNNSRNTFAYPTTLTDADGFSSSVQYNFDFGAKTRVQGPPPANQSNGIIQTFAYDSAARIQQVTTTNNGAYTRYLYGPNYVATQATVNAVADEAYTNTVFDGMGRTFLVGSNNPGSTSGYKAQVTRYDLMGRAVKQSNPAETDNAWNPVGPDDGAGWLYTQQSYDWKGRPRITTNTDGTQKSATYDGCGCAGGEVVTLTDEVGRQQKVYSDSLGRQWKSEVLNWDGSIYSTETSTLDTLDRVTFARQYQGTDQSGVYEETAMTYDGYGRLQSRHAPEQDAGRSTTYAYNPDNTLASVTDARGAVTTYNYNDARRLVTNVSYTAPSDITLPPSVTFGYDAAGNRTSMTTDGGAGGGVTYHYDTLSRVTSEDRQFPGLSGAYTLAYEYTLAGALKKLTDPVGDSISYGFDQTGRLTGVTGSSFAGVTTYASGITYRAWGAPKGVTYDGDSGSATTTYDERMRPQQHTLSVPATPANFNTGTSMREQYQYDGDGRLQQMTDLDDHSAMPGSPSTERRFSRRYTYDHAGRLTAASGVGASGQSYGLPFNQTFVYDEFDNLNQRYGSYYYEGYTQDVATFQNDRRQDWTYDADGRVVHSPFTATWNGVTGARDWSYDAAGRMTQVRDTKTSNGTTTTSTYVSSYDGDGLSVRSYSQESSTTSNSYMVRSTVLGGEVVTWLDNAGRKSKTVVKVDGLLMALQYPATVSGAQPFVTWLHSDPARMSEVTNGSGDKKSVYDPLGNYVSFQELPAPPAGYNPLYSPPPSGGLGSGFGFNGGSTNVACTLNGSPVNCNDAMHALDVGKASPCPNNDCGPQHISGEDENGKKGGGWVFFNGSGNFYSNGQDSGFADPDDVEYRDAYDPNSWAMNWGPKKRKEGGSRKRPKHVSQTTLPTPTPTQNPTPNPMSLLDRGTFYDSLGPCLQQELAPYYKMDLSKVRIHHFIPLAPKYIEHPSGYTAGWDVYFKSFLDRQGQFTDLAYEDMFHELAHVEQFQAGFFYEKYALNFGLNLYVGMPREKAYLFTQQEIDARKKASYVLQDYKSKHNGKLPCH